MGVEKDPNSSVLIWKGGGPFSNSTDVKSKLAATRKENERLQKLETTLEKHRFQIEQSLKILTDDLASQKFMYPKQKLQIVFARIKQLSRLKPRSVLKCNVRTYLSLTQTHSSSYELFPRQIL